MVKGVDMQLQSTISRGAHVLTQRALDTLVLLDARDGRYYALDEVGQRVWELCDGNRRVADVVRLLAEEYEVAREELEEDVLTLLDELADERLVVAMA